MREMRERETERDREVFVYVSVCMSDMGDKYCNVFSFPRELYRELSKLNHTPTYA